MTNAAPSNPSPDFDDSRLRQLLTALCDENLTDAETEEMDVTLSGSAAARSFYVRFMNVDAALHWEITARESVADLMPACQLDRGVDHHVSRWRPTYWAAMAIAGMVLVSGVLLFVNRRPDVQLAGQRPPVANVSSAESATIDVQVAAVTDLGPSAQWAVTPRASGPPTDLREHDVVCVTEGEIRVTFEAGAVVTLYAPAMMEVISPTRGRAIRGKLAAEVSDGSQGFTIETPQATVVDLGTVFGIEVGDEGATDVFVFKGAVDLHFDTQSRGVLPSAPQRLTSGEAMRIDKVGTPSRIVSISSDRFSSHPDSNDAEVSRPVLISAVTDNINRDEVNWNYYEIVHGGMREDAKAFVDRVAHEWNGLDKEGMPSFLLGGDYVKTFNNDKYSRDLELFVTVDRPCRSLHFT